MRGCSGYNAYWGTHRSFRSLYYGEGSVSEPNLFWFGSFHPIMEGAFGESDAFEE